MSINLDQGKIMAFAVFELRLLLAGHLGNAGHGEPAVRAAAHLAYALHNQALAVLEGKSFDTAEALAAIAKVDQVVGENFMQQLSGWARFAADPPRPAGCRLKQEFSSGARVVVSAAGGWKRDALGTVKGPPEVTETVQGEGFTYWIEFDEPQHDLSDDGPYGKAQVLSLYLRPIV